MSYDEYYDMYKKAQLTGKYHLFIFDIVNSRLYKQEIEYIEETSMLLFLDVYKRIKNLEEEKNITILHNIKNKDEPFANEPFKFGDLYGFTIIRGSVSSSEIYNIVEEEKERYNIYWAFHQKDGFYETDNYSEGNKKYYRGYCIAQLETLSKEKNIKLMRNNYEK
ncbi:MAG: hypothetical protein GX758_01225 [Tenericutes bacterium]|nr:hypothetical protein [Mycoplasmatota bacterium]